MKQGDKYNPFEDPKLHYSEPSQPLEDYNNRTAFNDVMKHYDIVNGHQVPKRIEHFPKRMRLFIRLFVLVGVMSFLIAQIWSIVETITEMR
jgi:hypothetical protein